MPPDAAPTFFIDRCLGKHLVAEKLREAGATVEVHDDYCPQNMKDPELLREIGVREWLFVTKDDRIRTRGIEKEALIYAGVGAFILGTRQGVTGRKAGQIFAKALRRMIRFDAKYKRPYIAKVGVDGSVVPLLGGGRRRK